jgi:hypothetical protein
MKGHIGELMGTPVIVSHFLKGKKEGYLLEDKIEDKIIVSPAMFILMKNSTPEELEHLMKNIKLRKIPKLVGIKFQGSIDISNPKKFGKINISNI